MNIHNKHRCVMMPKEIMLHILLHGWQMSNSNNAVSAVTLCISSAKTAFTSVK